MCHNRGLALRGDLAGEAVVVGVGMGDDDLLDVPPAGAEPVQALAEGGPGLAGAGARVDEGGALAGEQVGVDLPDARGGQRDTVDAGRIAVV